MKRWAALLCLGLLAGGTCAAAPRFDGRRWVRTARRAMTEFLNTAASSGNPELAKRAAVVRDALDTRRIHIQIPPDDPGTPLAGAEFILDQEGHPAFRLTSRFLGCYPAHRAFVLAVLMHETTHAYDYLGNPDGFFAQPRDGVERYLYEMDAAYLEAMFLRDIARPHGWKLSPFERYLLESLERDDLASYSTTFLATDMAFVYRFVRARKGPEPLEGLAQEFVAQAGARGDALVHDRPGDAWERYQALVSVRTVVGQGRELAATLVVQKRPGTDPKDPIDRHVPGFDAVMLRLQSLLDQEKGGLGYRERLLARMNAALEAP